MIYPSQRSDLLSALDRLAEGDAKRVAIGIGTSDHARQIIQDVRDCIPLSALRTPWEMTLENGTTISMVVRPEDVRGRTFDEVFIYYMAPYDVAYELNLRAAMESARA